MKSRQADDRMATQLFELRNILTNHCGEKLDPSKIDQILPEIETAITDGPASWAFKG